MYYGRKKWIIIAIVIAILVIVLVGVGLFLFLKTDLFKSNETLFYKYLGEQLSTFKYEDNQQQLELENLKDQKAYTVKGELSVAYEDMNETPSETSKATTELFENLKLTIDGKYDKVNEKENVLYKIIYGTQNLFELESAKTKDIYALKSNEIVSNAYVGVRNDNLKVFAQKLGIDTNTTQILPNKIEDTNIKSNSFKISEEEAKHIQETYSPVISSVVTKNNFSKQNNVAITDDTQTYKCNSYRLDLTGEQVKNLVTAILTELQQDSITLNLIATNAKLLGASEDYTDINKLTVTIQNLINNINNTNGLFESGLSIVVYESEGKTISIEIILKNEAKLTISNKVNNNSTILNVKIDNLSADESFATINVKLVNTKTSTQTISQIEIVVDNETTITLSYESNGSASTNNVENNISATFASTDITLTANYAETVEFKDSITDIIELNNTNTAILNDYTKEQLNVFVPAVVQRAMVVFNEKLMSLNMIPNNTQQQIQ